MDCYYHNAVPSVSACLDCKQPICATCRSAEGNCPGCRLAARIDAATVAGELPGQVPPRPQRSTPPPQPPPQPPYEQPYDDYGPPQRRPGAAVAVRAESRALAALSYPFWPLALLALLDTSKSPFVRRNALQALGFNAGIYGLWFALSAIASIPMIGLPALPLLFLVVPVGMIASVIYGFKTWHGDDVRVPIISEYIDSKVPVH